MTTIMQRVTSEEDVFDIEPDDLTVYRVVRPWTIDSEKPTEPVLEPCRMYSNTIERVCALCPSDDIIQIYHLLR